MNGRPRSSLSVRDARAAALRDVLGATPALIVEDVHRLPALRSWNRQAIDVASGDLTDDAYGRLHVRRSEEAA